MALDLEVEDVSGHSGVPPADTFGTWLTRALGDTANGSLAVRIVSLEEMTSLNQRYRGKDGATNVLSFPVEIPEAVAAGLPARPLGDIVICAPVVEQEAAEQGKSLDAHWAHLAIHGLLHLLGYDHQQQEKAEAMEALEVRLLGSLGFPNPYE